MIHFHRSTGYLASLTALVMLFVATIATPAHSAAPIEPIASAVSTNAPPPVEYVGGIGGTLAGLAVNGGVAYIGEGSSLTVLDITNTAHPTRVARLPLATLPADMVVADGRLYVAAGSAGLLIYDIGDPKAPALIGVFVTPAPSTRIRVQNGIAYLAAGDMLIVDVQNPAAPQQLGSYHPPAPINNLTVSEDRVYLAYGYTFSHDRGGVSIVDVATPTAPAAIGGITLTEEAVLDVQVNGNLFYAITTVDWRYSFQDPRLFIADISNVASPMIIGSYTIPGFSPSTRQATLLLANDFAYVAGYTYGLLTIDVHIPETPTPAAQTASLGGNAGLQMVGELLFAVTGGIGYSTPGFQVISLHTPTSPVQVGGYDTLPLVEGVDVADGIASVSHYDRGFQLVDVHDPAQPKMRGAYMMGGGPSAVQVIGNLAYVTGGNTGFHIMDVSNPDNPLRLGGFDPNGSTRAIRVIGNLAYISGINRLVIEDVGDPAHPIQLAAYDYYTGDDSGVDVAGNRAYFATGNNGLVILDISNPANPVQRGIYNGLVRFSDVQVVGNRAYLAAGSDGLVVLDLTNPDSPTLLGQFRTPQAYYVRVVGELAYVTDIMDGLHIIDIRDPANLTSVAEYKTGAGLGKVQVIDDLMYVPAGSAGLHIVRLHFDRFAASAAIGTAGGELTTVDGSVDLSVPPGAVASTATLTVTPALDPTLLPDAGSGTLRAVRLDARDSGGQPIAQFGRPYTLSMSYTDAQVAALKINEATLHVVSWNGTSWSAAPPCSSCGVDTALNRVTLEADHVGAFALVGSAGPTITSTTPPASALIRALYRHVFTASGSPAPTFHISSGALPPGLSLDSATGVLEGAPTALGSYTFTVTASNGTLPDATQAVTLVVRSAIYMPLINGVP